MGTLPLPTQVGMDSMRSRPVDIKETTCLSGDVLEVESMPQNGYVLDASARTPRSCNYSAMGAAGMKGFPSKAS